MDVSEEMVKAVFDTYSKVVRDGGREPLPMGAQHWGRAMDYLSKKGYVSMFLQNLETDETDQKLVIEETRQPFVPKEEEYTAAIGDLCSEIARKLHNFPLWKQKLLHVMLQDFGANPD